MSVIFVYDNDNDNDNDNNNNFINNNLISKLQYLPNISDST